MTDPSRHIDELRDQFTRDLEQAGAEAEVRAVRDRYLSRRSGLVSGLLRTLGSAPPEDRPRLGQLVNRLKADIDERLAARLAAVASARPPKGSVDVTLPGRVPAVGHRHPLSILREEIEGIFTRYGFLIIEGPELEDDYHNFEALNMPPEHPARDMQDTLYLGGAVRSLAGAAATLLRTHTSGMQIRHMETHPPPVRLIAPGRVYRRDNFDLTHTPMFTQVEGLVVGETVTLADLKGTLTAFAHELFGAERRVRFRPSFFPYTEPSAELDISCAACGGTGRAAKPEAASTVRPVPVESAPMSSGRGAVPPEPAPTLADRGRASTEPAQTLGSGGGGTPGCAMCKRTGWLEILGSGMVHPAVFEAVGYDPEQYTGFAFGMGIERAALLKWGVEDIRLFYENDLRFLEQFPL
ncbi:MAG TPA: phenylalanine--tRNA ligase subunit alpha [Vicinamibacterales bacterium]|nr:phenylalanine--tRNA ligase subunit alpha [Vicinamibacterales bacterium]